MPLQQGRVQLLRYWEIRISYKADSPYFGMLRLREFNRVIPHLNASINSPSDLSFGRGNSSTHVLYAKV